MREFMMVIGSIGLTAVSWGLYGPLMRWGTAAMFHPDAPQAKSHLLPFVCVGISYCVLAVVVPICLLKLWSEKGTWTMRGFLWSFVSGVLGALGALGIILAFHFGGRPDFVMPLVFGCAPVANAFVTMYLLGNFRQMSPFFMSGLILVVAGALIVLLGKPKPPESKDVHGAVDFVKVLFSIGLTVVCWGAYGPILHRGQMMMQGSRLRPLICVGLAYLVVAVVLTSLLIPLVTPGNEWDKFTASGAMWSLTGGAAGALGAIGIILAFTFGGKPVYVMPLVFGIAPIVNTLITIGPGLRNGEIESVSPLFYAGLIIVIIGAATVLIFAPKSPPNPALH